MRTCPHALAAGQIPIMSELLHVLDASSEAQDSQSTDNYATHYYVERPNHSGMKHPSKTDWY